MAHSSNSKIVLKSTTKMSLNDRFSAYRKNANNTVGIMRQKAQQETRQNSKTWRLMQQMESRPVVMAALKIKKRSLKQRLGIVPKSNVKSRLSLGGGGGGNAGMVLGQNQRFRGGRGRLNFRGGRIRGGGGRGGQFGNSFGSNFRGSQWSLSSASQLQGRLGSARDNNGQQQQWKARRGAIGRVAKGQDNRNRLGRGGRDFRRVRGSFRNVRGNFRRNNQGTQQQQQQPRGGGRSGKRGGGAAGAVSRGRGRGRGGQQSLPSKQALDNELDEYMSRTRGNLDMELESYMAQTQAD